MREGLLKGVGFGLTSGVITTLGIIIGLHSGTESKLSVLVGIIILAVADAFSDSLGIHVSEEAEGEHTSRELWESTLYAFLSKLLVALSFVIPLELLELSTAIIASIVWGLVLITVFSVYMAKSQEKSTYKVLAEHIIIAVLVMIVAHLLGDTIHEML